MPIHLRGTVPLLKFKVGGLYLNHYKMFENFKIDFIDVDEKALPIIIIAGENGTGKTTLLEYLVN